MKKSGKQNGENFVAKAHLSQKQRRQEVARVTHIEIEGTGEVQHILSKDV
jgi:hypothetical protein